MAWGLVQGAGLSLLGHLPVVAVWTAVMILGIRMARKGDGKAQKFIAAGGGIKLTGILLSVILQYVIIGLVISDRNTELYATASEAVTWFLDIISLIGYLCLFYAFWLKCTAGEEPRANPPYISERPHPSATGLPNQPR